jgi:hypothetical protein
VDVPTVPVQPNFASRNYTAGSAFAFPAVVTGKEYDDQLSDYYEPDKLLPLFPIDDEQYTIGPTNTNFLEDEDPTTYSQYDEWSNIIPFVPTIQVKKPKPLRLAGVP